MARTINDILLEKLQATPNGILKIESKEISEIMEKELGIKESFYLHKIVRDPFWDENGVDPNVIGSTMKLTWRDGAKKSAPKVKIKRERTEEDQYDPNYFEESEEYRLAKLHLDKNRNMFVHGPSGSGKTSAIFRIAANQARRIFRVNFHVDFRESDFLGDWFVKEGTMSFREGVLPEMLRTENAIMILDEISFCPSEILSILHPVLEGSPLTLTKINEVILPAPNTCFVATDNTNGGGDLTGMYSGLRKLNEALLNRFPVFLKMDYLTKEQERKVLMKRTDLDFEHADSIAELFVKLRTAFKDSKISFAPSTRLAITLAQFYADGMEPADALRSAIEDRVNEEDKAIFKELIRAVGGPLNTKVGE